MDLLPAAPSPPVQKRDAQHMFLQHRGSHAESFGPLTNLAWKFHSRNTKFHSRNGLSRLDQYETHNSRSNSRSDSRNCRERTRKIFICPFILGAFFRELGWSPRTRIIKVRSAKVLGLSHKFWAFAMFYSLSRFFCSRQERP